LIERKRRGWGRRMSLSYRPLDATVPEKGAQQWQFGNCL